MRRLPLLMVLGAGVPFAPGAATPADGQEVEWQEQMRNPIRAVVQNHYGRALINSSGGIDCLGRKGDICFGGDHEDYRCMSIAPCRTEAAMFQFMDELERAARRRPDDPHTIAQAVYGLARLRYTDRALKVAQGCEAVRWWCDLVLGMAYQRAERSVDAEGNLQMGLLGADQELACRLTDIEYLLDGRDGATYSVLPCPSRERGEFEERFWWLSDPLLTRPGNDRWTEHVTRRLELLLHERLWEVIRPNYLLSARGLGHNLVYMNVVTRRGAPDFAGQHWKVQEPGGVPLPLFPRVPRGRRDPGDPLRAGSDPVGRRIYPRRVRAGLRGSRPGRPLSGRGFTGPGSLRRPRRGPALFQ